MAEPESSIDIIGKLPVQQANESVYSQNEGNIVEVIEIQAQNDAVSKTPSQNRRGRYKKKIKDKVVKDKNGEPNLPFYARRKLIPLLENDFMLGNESAKSELTSLLNYQEDQADNLIKYIECQAKQGEKNSELDNCTESFSNISKWLNLLRDKNMNEITGNEIPLLFKCIANMEVHPNPEEVGDINLRELYTFVSNIMLGYPTKAPTGMTAKFLSETFKDITSELVQSEPDLSPIDAQLKNSTLLAGPNSSENFILEEMRLMLGNSSTNPFNFDFEFLTENCFENISVNSEEPIK